MYIRRVYNPWLSGINQFQCDLLYLFTGGVRPPHAKYDWSQLVAAASLCLSLRPDNHQLWILSPLKHSSPGWRPWHIWCQNTPLSTQKLFTVNGRFSIENSQNCPGSGQDWTGLRYQSNWFLENIENSECRAVCISVVHSQEVFFSRWNQTQISTFLAPALSWLGEARTVTRQCSNIKLLEHNFMLIKSIKFHVL